jgi:hypothetical protein
VFHIYDLTYVLQSLFVGTRTLSVKISQTGPGVLYIYSIFRAGLFFTARAIFQYHLPCVVYRICKRPKHISMMGTWGDVVRIYCISTFLCARMIIFILCCSTRTCNTWHNPIPLSNISLSLSLYLSLFFFLFLFLFIFLLPSSFSPPTSLSLSLPPSSCQYFFDVNSFSKDFGFSCVQSFQKSYSPSFLVFVFCIFVFL